MEKIVFSNEYFNLTDTLSCGQIFRFKEYKNGYLVFSNDKICYAYVDGDNTIIETEDKDYFYNFFDLVTDYSKIYNSAISYGNQTLKISATLGKGVRILRQDSFEMTFSFLISQNNNIKRISNSIEHLSEKVGTKKSSPFGEYYAFPTIEQLKTLTIQDYKDLGLGYRAEYFYGLVELIYQGFLIENLKDLSEQELYNSLVNIKGIGDKVANCIMLFGFYKTKSFPVDTWTDKIYRENFNGKLKDRKKITEWFISEFGEFSGYFQQYLFYYKRSLEKQK